MKTALRSVVCVRVRMCVCVCVRARQNNPALVHISPAAQFAQALVQHINQLQLQGMRLKPLQGGGSVMSAGGWLPSKYAAILPLAGEGRVHACACTCCSMLRACREWGWGGRLHVCVRVRVSLDAACVLEQICTLLHDA